MKSKSYKAESASSVRSRGLRTNRTLDLRLDVTADDPHSEVAKMFALARSSGKELNITFGLGVCSG